MGDGKSVVNLQEPTKKKMKKGLKIATYSIDKMNQIFFGCFLKRI